MWANAIKVWVHAIKVWVHAIKVWANAIKKPDEHKIVVKLTNINNKIEIIEVWVFQYPC